MRRYRTTSFADRRRAGEALADALAGTLDPARTVVAGIPRGGISVALPVVERFRTPLAVVYARKLTSPLAPELAFGALDEDGEMVTDDEIVRELGLGPDGIAEAQARVGREIRRRMALYPAPPLGAFLPGRDVVLVDDGLATGLTMLAAVRYARRHGAGAITVAAPCASSSAAERFAHEADRVVSVIVDPMFMAVGAYYVDFSPVSDDEVVAMLRRAAAAAGGGAAREGAPAAPVTARVSFPTTGGRRLAGELWRPAGPGPHPAVAFAHGWGSDKASPRNRPVAAGLVAAGVAALLFDFTGHGESEGTAEESTLAQQAADLRAALDTLARESDVDASRLAVVGASSGAAVALRLAAGDARITALALRSPNVEGAEDVAVRVRVPVLLVVGERDAPTRAMCEALRPRLGDARLEIVRGGDHLFEDPEALAHASALIVGWLADRLTRPEVPRAAAAR